ncbi:coproporphyrinogen III oxidase [Burkholderia thailandensis]|nr:coproporphyrinogen III oxidase [Burkholderia thailandensis]AVR11478.1 coproporphyrinogen III oxidase [Burkholderia thailandensis]AWY58934.1 coproporphyrinogen III oxidase [Burkholderia thailandensis]AWY66897.1 coproporphyrinogen III oxidase [Burkholderia thailandensis]KVG05744.1 coproporphyrinogen III oxidase [Burkholderia thailandensis]
MAVSVLVSEIGSSAFRTRSESMPAGSSAAMMGWAWVAKAFVHRCV